VYPAPAPAFSLSDTAGCSPLTISFSNQTGYPNQLQGNLTWHLGNGLLYNGHSNVPNQTYINTTAQPVKYRVVLYATTTFGCRDSVVKTITVFPRPRPAFVTPRDTLNQDSAVFTFLNRTRPAGNWTYTWRWGDGRDTTVTDTLPIAHRYDTVGRIRVSLVVVTPNGCRDSVVRFVVIRPVKPIVSFFINEGDTVVGCRPLTISVKNLTRYGRDYRWDFGNGVLYTVAAPPPVTYYNAGVYSIKLLVRNAAGNDSLIRRRVVVAEDNPKAAFSLSPAEVVVPDQATQFVNLSRGASSYRWNFGDGSTSEEVSPRYTYQDTGRFDVTLIAATRGGCLDTFTIRQAVKARFDGRIVVPNAFTPLSTTGLNDVFLPKMDGAIAYRMLVFNRWGEIMFESSDQNSGWDGRHRGQMCTPDQYVYRIEVTFSNGISKTETGKVYLVR
jgi:gliding motility-associated-like protein